MKMELKNEEFEKLAIKDNNNNKKTNNRIPETAPIFNSPNSESIIPKQYKSKYELHVDKCTTKLDSNPISTGCTKDSKLIKSFHHPRPPTPYYSDELLYSSLLFEESLNTEDYSENSLLNKSSYSPITTSVDGDISDPARFEYSCSMLFPYDCQNPKSQLKKPADKLEYYSQGFDTSSSKRSKLTYSVESLELNVVSMQVQLDKENQRKELQETNKVIVSKSGKGILQKRSSVTNRGKSKSKPKRVRILPYAEAIKPGPSFIGYETDSSDEESMTSIKKCNSPNSSDDDIKGTSCTNTESKCLPVYSLNKFQEISRPRRIKKTSLKPQNCPLCEITLHSTNVQEHFCKEKERLEKWHRNMKKKKMHQKLVAEHGIRRTNQVKNLKETVKEVIEHRRERVIAQHELLKPWKNVSCPSCHLPLKEPNDFLHHKEICATIQEDTELMHSNEYNMEVESDLDEAMRLANVSSGSVVRLTRAEEEIDYLDVEIQIEEEFGEQQYYKENLDSVAYENAECNKCVEASEKIKETPTNNKTDEKDIIIDNLKFKIMELENMWRDEPLCAVCMSRYKVPLVSVICWHVYCEECWLNTLNIASLCPLCKVITNVRHLRRVYI